MVAVFSGRDAMDGHLPDVVSKGKRGTLAARPGVAFGISAGLAALRGVHSFKPDTFGMDFDGVSIDDRRAACEVLAMAERGCRNNPRTARKASNDFI